MRIGVTSAGAVFLIAVAASAFGQTRQQAEVRPPAVSSARLRLDDVIAQVLHANPALDAARSRRDAAAAAGIEVNALPDPRLRTGFYSIPFPSLDAGAAQVRLQLTQEFPHPGTLQRRAAVEALEAERRTAAVDATSVQLAAAARRAYHELHFAHEAQEIQRRHLTLVRELSAAAEARYATGMAPQEDVLRSLQELTVSFVRLSDVDSRLLTERAALNSLLHRDPDAPVDRPAAPGPLSWTGLDLPAALAAADASPALRAAATAVEREEARIIAERHESKPDFAVMAEWWTGPDGLGGRHERYAVLGTITLPWANRGKYDAAVQRATAGRRVAAADRLALRDQMRRDVAAAWHRADASARIVELYRTALLPQSEATLQAARAAYETAATPFVSVVSAERDLLNSRLGLVRSEADFGLALADLAEAMGVIYLPQEEGRP